MIFASALAGLALFAPTGSDFEVMAAVFGSGSERVRWVDVLLSLLPILAVTLLEPFYVGGGFALYLNRRVELEGWDLEVAFRKAAARITKTPGPNPGGSPAGLRPGGASAAARPARNPRKPWRRSSRAPSSR